MGWRQRGHRVAERENGIGERDTNEFKRFENISKINFF